MKLRSTFLMVIAIVLMLVFPVYADTNNNNNNTNSNADANANAGISGVNGNTVEIQSPSLRSFPFPGSWSYAPMPSEFLNDTGYANIQQVSAILQFADTYYLGHLQNMSGGKVKVLQFTDLYGNSEQSSDAQPSNDSIVFIFKVSDSLKKMNPQKIGSIVAKGEKDTTTEQVLAKVGLEALKIKGAKYVLITSEGMQKYTKTSGWGIALGYTQSYIGDNQQNAGTGTLGIGYSSGKAGRQADPFISATVLTDGDTLKGMLKK